MAEIRIVLEVSHVLELVWARNARARRAKGLVAEQILTALATVSISAATMEAAAIHASTVRTASRVDARNVADSVLRRNANRLPSQG